MPATTTPTQRSRPLYAFMALLAVGTGLLWRSRLLSLPPFLAKYGGDALWALLVFLGWGLLLCHASTLRIAFIAVCFATFIELLQLYHAPWIDLIRTTRVGHLVLGSTFNSPDLLAYAVGVALGALAERACLNTRGPASAVD